MRFQVLTILTLENNVLRNVALYKYSYTGVSKECYASVFSLFDIYDDSILQSARLFIYRNLPRLNFIANLSDFFYCLSHRIYEHYRKSHKYKRLDGKSERNRLCERLRHRWRMKLRERPTKYSLHLSKLLIPTVSSISCDVTLFYRLTCNRMVLKTSLHSRQDFQD